MPYQLRSDALNLQDCYGVKTDQITHEHKHMKDENDAHRGQQVQNNKLDSLERQRYNCVFSVDCTYEATLIDVRFDCTPFRLYSCTK